MHPFLRNVIMFALMRCAVIFALFLSATVSSVNASSVSQALAEIMRADPQAGVLLERRGTTILAHNADELYIPASLVKVPLSLSAYELLGKNFHFVTDFYIDDERNLLVRGQGDPFLVSEEWEIIARRVKRAGYHQFNQLYLDNSLFEGIDLPGRGASDNPYDARIHALFVNFNTMNLLLNKDGSVISAEEQTPTLPLMQSYADKLRCCAKKKRIQLGDNPQISNQYAAELIHNAFANQRISFTNKNSFIVTKVTSGANNKWQPLYTHANSRSLAQVLENMLYHSTNTIASATLLQFSAVNTQRPTLQDALARWQQHLKKMLPRQAAQQLRLFDGAGLERKNQLSARTMMQFLRHFEPHKHLLRYYADIDAFYKTGTLQGACNAAGFLKNGDLFVLFTDSCEKRKKILQILTQLNS